MLKTSTGLSATNDVKFDSSQLLDWFLDIFEFFMSLWRSTLRGRGRGNQVKGQGFGRYVNIRLEKPAENFWSFLLRILNILM